MPPLPVVATPAQPVPQVSSDDDGGWKVVTRRSREVARRVIYQGSCSNSFHTLAIAEDQIVDNAQPEPGGEVQANPSLS